MGSKPSTEIQQIADALSTKGVSSDDIKSFLSYIKTNAIDYDTIVNDIKNQSKSRLFRFFCDQLNNKKLFDILVDVVNVNQQSSYKQHSKSNKSKRSLSLFSGSTTKRMSYTAPKQVMSYQCSAKLSRNLCYDEYEPKMMQQRSYNEMNEVADCCDDEAFEYERCSSSLMRASYHSNNNDNIGLSMGGSRDTNNFRHCIQRNIMPSVDSITYNGVLYQYYFDTETRKYGRNEEIKNDDDASMLFYPTYCYAKTKKLDIDEAEYYMTVGLNSNIKQSEFKRKHLNLIILWDQSGSMNDTYYHFSHNLYNAENTKMKSAKGAIQCIISHLTVNDRLGIVTFNEEAEIIQKLELFNAINMEVMMKNIENVTASGGTNFEKGYIKSMEIYSELFNNDDVSDYYDNRVIVLTDAQPNEGMTDCDELVKMIEKYAENKAKHDDIDDIDDNKASDIENEYIRNGIYTTFIGVGLDFNSSLIDKISATRGCNYYSVKSTKEFDDAMHEDFDNMVTPLVFNVCLKLKCEGNLCEIEKVYGLSQDKANDIILNGEITKINTLFPSKKSKKRGGGTKGGIQLIKLKKNNNNNNCNDNINVEIEVSFEDRNGKKYENIQNVTFNPPKEKINNDMIENDEKEREEINFNFYDNLGIRKAILLCKYVELIKKWIKVDGNKHNKYNKYGSLTVNQEYKKIFSNFMEYFKKEMKECDDDTLKQEIDVMEKLIIS